MLGLDQAAHTVECNAAIIADDAAAAISIRQPSDDAGLPALHDLWRVGVEHAVVMGLAVLGERFMDLRIGLDVGRLQPRLDHSETAIRKNGSLERLIGLQSDDHLMILVDVAGLVREQRRWRARIGIEDTLLPLLLEIRLQLGPHRLGLARGRRQEFLVTQIGLNVARDEIAHIDRRPPGAGRKFAPCIFRTIRNASGLCHGYPPRGRQDWVG